MWDEIAKNLGGCQTVRFKSNLSQRAVRERLNLIQGRFKENENTELAASGIYVPEQDELDVLLEDISERERDAIAEASEKNVRRRLQQKISETKLWRGWGKQRNENLKTAKSQRKGNPGEAVMRLSSLYKRRLNQTRHSEKKS